MSEYRFPVIGHKTVRWPVCGSCWGAGASGATSADAAVPHDSDCVHGGMSSYVLSPAQAYV